MLVIANLVGGRATFSTLEPYRMSNDAAQIEPPDPRPSVLTTPSSTARQQTRIALRMLCSLLLGGTLVLGAIMVFRQGLLPLIDVMFQPGPETLSVIRRAGILFTAIAGYWVYVRLHERRKAAELRLKPVSLLLGGAGGAVLIGIPIALLFAIGAYELVLLRGASTALFGVAALIGIAATLEELVFRCLLFRVIERAWGTAIAIPIQAVLFALQHLENVEQGGTIDAVIMIVTVIVLGAFWAGVFVFTRNLWATAANHAAWNFTILLSGVPLSGIEDWRTVAPLESRYAGPDWLTGGMFGPESSVLVIAVATIATILLLRAARRRGKFIAQAARN